MILCRTCQHRTRADTCVHRLETLGGIHWCDMISECTDHLPRDNTQRHVNELQVLTTSERRTRYLADIEREEAADARQRAADAFAAWWHAHTPAERRAVVEMASFGDPKLARKS